MSLKAYNIKSDLSHITLEVLNIWQIFKDGLLEATIYHRVLPFSLSIRRVSRLSAIKVWQGLLFANESPPRYEIIRSVLYSLNRTPLSPCHASPCLHCCRHCWRLAMRLSPTQWTTQVLFAGVWWVSNWLQAILTLYSLNVIVFFMFERVHSFLVQLRGSLAQLWEFLPMTRHVRTGHARVEAGFLFLLPPRLQEWSHFMSWRVEIVLNTNR